VKILFTVGDGVINEALLVMGVGVAKVNPHSVENVTSWSHFVIVTLDAKPVRVVAQMVVIIGA
jgi:hypothetical protein